MFLYSRLDKKYNQDIQDIGFSFVNGPKANIHPFIDYDEEIRSEIAKEKETALNELKNLKFIFPEKQEYQPIVINSFKKNTLSQEESNFETQTVFDKIVAIALLEKCDIKTISRMRLLNKWWNNIILNHINKVWELELKDLRIYFKILFPSSILNNTDTSETICYVPNQHDNDVITKVISMLYNDNISPFDAVSYCYSTIRHIELKNGRIKYILVEPNPNHLFDETTPEIGNVIYDLEYSGNLFEGHSGLYDSFNTHFPSMNIAPVGNYIIDHNLDNYYTEEILFEPQRDALLPAGHFIGMNTN